MPTRPINLPRPYVFVVIATVVLVVLLGIAGTATYLLRLPIGSPVPLVFLPIAIGIGIWVTITKRWGVLGFRGMRARSSVALAALVPLAAVLLLTSVFTGGIRDQPLPVWIGIVGLVLLVAFVEEVLFRSIFVSALLRLGIPRAVVGSSLAFALAHSVNVLSGQDLGTTVRQVVFAVAFGLAAASVFVRTGSIWPTLVFHVVFNFIQLSSAHQTPALVDWISVGVLLAGTGWLWLDKSTARNSTAVDALAAMPLPRMPAT